MTHPPRVLPRALALLLAAGALSVAPLSAAQAVAPVVGAQTSGDLQFPNVGNGGYDVSHYDIDIDWTPAGGTIISPIPQSIVATTTITAATTGAPLSQFSLDLKGLVVDSVMVNGAAATFARETNAAQTKYKLVVTPATPVDGVFTTVVGYHGTPTDHTDADGSTEGWVTTSDGATFLNQPIGAMTGYPNNNTNQDKATYRFTLDVPKVINGGDSAAVSNGVLTSRSAPAGGRWTWVWDVAKPMPPSLSMISIGRYNMSTPVDGLDITLASGRVVQEWSFWDPAASNAGYSSMRNNLKNYLDFFEARYGPYPGNSIGMVFDNTSGINYALETQDRPFFPGSVTTPTNIHEVMHQWFGNNVTPEYWSDLWLSEGPADYAERQYPSESGTETAFYNEWNSTAPGSATWTTPAANPSDTNPADLYGAHVYDRGGMALEALRTAIGPTAFLATMREWQVRYGGTSQGTEDFVALAEEVSGKDLTAFFQDWIYDANKPAWPGKFTLSLASTPSSGMVAPNSAVTYTVSAANTGKVALTGAAVTLDLADVLDDATITGSLPANTSLDGTTLTWTVPSTAVAATAQLSLPLTVKGSVTSGTLAAVAAPSAATLGGTCATCATTLSAGLQTLTPTANPTITGTAQVGRTLTAGTAGWASGTSFSYAWKRNGTAIGGATASTYDLVAADLGSTVTVEVTGTKAGFAPAARTSAPTGAVVEGVQSSTPTPTITGAARVGQPLTAVAGGWDAGVTTSYRWAADGADIDGATGSTYTPVDADIGKTVTVTVTGTRPGYATVERTSAPTAAIVTSQLSTTPTPTISGTARVGETLTAATGAWDDGAVLTYQWVANGTPIAGARGATYKQAAGDVGKRIAVKVTGTKSGFDPATRTSAQTAPVAKGRLPLGPTPVIVGRPKVGKTLDVTSGLWPDGIKVRYQWYVGTRAIPGATSTELKLRKRWKGKRILVKVTGTKAGYESRTVRSARTKRVV